MNNTCGNCKFFNEHRKMINGSYICDFHNFTIKPDELCCYKIQFSIKNETNNIFYK